MPKCVYALGVHLWRAAYDRLPDICRKRPPNLAVLQTYSRAKGDFMDYHTDARPTFHGQKIMQVLAPAFPVRVPLPEPPDPCSAAGGGLRGDDVHHRVQLDVLLLYRLPGGRCEV